MRPGLLAGFVLGVFRSNIGWLNSFTWPLVMVLVLLASAGATALSDRAGVDWD